MGLQRQAHGPSVQRAVEEAVFAVTGEKATLHAAGRTYEVTGAGYVPTGALLLDGEEAAPPEPVLELLRAAALASDAESHIYNIGQIERGYERIDERLRALGADIEKADSRS